MNYWTLDSWLVHPGREVSKKAIAFSVRWPGKALKRLRRGERTGGTKTVSSTSSTCVLNGRPGHWCKSPNSPLEPLCKPVSDVRNDGERAGVGVQSRRVHTSFFY